MARTKSFSTHTGTPAEPVELVINDKTFHCQETMPGQTMLDFLAGTSSEDPASMAGAVEKIFEEAIVPEEYEEWSTYIRARENNVSLDKLSEMAGWLVEEYSGRPQ